MQGVIQEQAVLNLQPLLPGLDTAPSGNTPTRPSGEGESALPPAQLGFPVYRVNDYDLQIQHNEAFNLAVDHLGMTRTKTVAFFDGTLGQKLVKIVPFNHPVTPLALEEVKELNHRPEEERDIVVVDLGKERRSRSKPGWTNGINSASGAAFPTRSKSSNCAPIPNTVASSNTNLPRQRSLSAFWSPTAGRRKSWSKLPRSKIDALKSRGKYIVEAKKGATVAIKMTDMLGEEVLVVKQP